jgi:gamma-glutamylcyclotransferase
MKPIAQPAEEGQLLGSAEPLDVTTPELQQPEESTYHWLFSYGSNNRHQLTTRIQRAGPIEHLPAYLPNHARIFAGYSKRWGGGVASVISAEGLRVYGAVAKVTEEELDRMDAYESGYTREFKNVVIQGKPSQVASAVVYVKDDDTYQEPPSEAYLMAIHRTLSEVDRPHKSNILIRAYDCEKQHLQVVGSWEPSADV